MMRQFQESQTDYSIRDAQAQAELAVEKVILEKSHLHFTAHFFKELEGNKFLIGPHHRVMSQSLDRVLRGECKRLLINVPPGFTKSQCAVISFIAHGLAINPQSRFIHATYSEKLALDNSSKVRDTVNLETFQRHWPVELRADTNAKGLWRTAEGGGLMASPSGGTITGFRAGHMVGGFSGCLILDDPLKPDDARYPERRKIINDRYMNTFRSRLAHEDVPIIIIMQRLDVNDMSGFILEGGGGEVFEHLWLPAEIRNSRPYPVEWTHGRPIPHDLPDGPLWPEKLNMEDLAILKTKEDVYAAQYDQEPLVSSSDFFKAEWIKEVDEFPPIETLSVYGASDYAVTSKGGDYTVHSVLGVDHEDNLYLLDLWREQASSDVWVDAFCDLVKKWKPLGWAEETGQIKSGVGPFLVKRMLETGAYVARETFPTRGDKSVRAQSIRGRMAMKGLRVMRGSPWLPDFYRELLRFPYGANDDMVDSIALGGQLLDKMMTGPKPAVKKEIHTLSTIDDFIVPPIKPAGRGRR